MNKKWQRCGNILNLDKHKENANSSKQWDNILTGIGLAKMLVWQYQMLTKKQKLSCGVGGKQKLVPLL